MLSSVKTFEIVLNGRRSYVGGETITGDVVLELTRERKITELTLDFLGIGKSGWTELLANSNPNVPGFTDIPQQNSIVTSEQEIYLNRRIQILQSSDGEVPAGYHKCPFSFKLPVGIPSSFNGNYGCITYTITVTLKNLGLSKTVSILFGVQGTLDIDALPGPTKSARLEVTKEIGHLFWKQGPIKFIFQLNRKGFLPGEPLLAFSLEMTNQSNKPVRWTRIRVKRMVLFHARGNSKLQEEVVLEFTGPGVGGGESLVWSGDSNENNRMPSHLSPTNLGGGSKVISLRYFLYIKMHSPSGSNLEASSEIIIGSIPTLK